MGWWYLQTAGFCCVYSIKLQTASFDGCDNNYIQFRMAPQGMQLRRTWVAVTPCLVVPHELQSALRSAVTAAAPSGSDGPPGCRRWTTACGLYRHGSEADVTGGHLCG